MNWAYAKITKNASV